MAEATEAVVLPGTAAAPVIDTGKPPVTPTAEQAAADATAKEAADKAAADAAAAQAAKQPIKFAIDEEKPPLTPATSNVVVYEKTGDAGLDVALQYIGARGFGPDHPAVVAATKGDFAILDAELAKLGDKAPGAKAYVDLAKQSYERKQSAVSAANATTAKAVHDAVGGAANWEAIKAWTQENAEPDEKRQLNAAFAVGGFAATAAAKELAALWQQAGNKPKSAVKETATRAAPSDGPLDGKAYGLAVAALSAKLGNRMQGSQEYAALQARRRAHRG